MKQSVAEICQREGHLGKWQEYVYYTEEVTKSQSGNRYMYTKHSGWKRTCQRCGKEERTTTKPLELLSTNEKGI